MADTIRCIYSLDEGYFCTKHSNAFYDASCRLLDGEPCEDQKPTKPTTNYDRLIRKTPEEMARWIADELIEPGYYAKGQAYELWLGWLKQEVSE